MQCLHHHSHGSLHVPASAGRLCVVGRWKKAWQETAQGSACWAPVQTAMEDRHQSTSQPQPMQGNARSLQLFTVFWAEMAPLILSLLGCRCC